jgi:uncharacterized membrane protein
MPDPLHPAVVHLPVALAALIPLGALAALLAIWRGFLPTRAWWAVVLLQALLVGSAWLAVETGEREEERVEEVVAESRIEAHEEAAERFLALAGAGLLVIGAGLLPHRTGQVARAAGALAAVGVLAAGIQVGHSGGELVYRHGAARVYAERYAERQAAGANGDSVPAYREEEDSDSES